MFVYGDKLTDLVSIEKWQKAIKTNNVEPTSEYSLQKNQVFLPIERSVTINTNIVALIKQTIET